MKTIIEMAREAGFDLDGMANMLYTVRGNHAQLERFAALVRADEREAWEHKYARLQSLYARLQSLMEIRETQPNKPCCLAEREACAKVCDEMRTYVGRNNAVTQSSAQDCAAAIRARGNK